MNRLADLRIPLKSLDDARKAFDSLAMLIIKTAAREAACEKRIARLKHEHDVSTEADRKQIQTLEADITAFIQGNKQLFKDPRKVQTAMGSFGLQAVSDLIIVDEEVLLKHLVGKQMKDCYETVEKLIKKAIKKRIEAGESMPSAKINKGDTAVYKVDKSLIDAAKNESDS